MSDKFSATPPEEPHLYYYKDKPLQHFYNNNYTKEEKLEIVMQLESDYKAGMLSVSQCRWIYNNSRFGSFTATRIMDDMMKRKMSGNLSDEEEKFLSSSLNGLKMNYLEESNKPKSEPEAQDDKSSNDSESDDSKNNSIDRNETSPEARDDKSSNDSESDDSKNNSIDRNETSKD